jgi:hypothetical protein
VTDSVTGLQWQDNYSDNGDNIKSAKWTEAIEYCEGLGLDGGGWRLPNKKELLSLVDYTEFSPSIDSAFAYITSYYYWSSTTHAYDTDYAWLVRFRYGYMYNSLKADTDYVRCVR